MPKHLVLLIIHIMYGLQLSVTSFKNAGPRKNKCVRWKSCTRIRTGTAEKENIRALQRNV